MTGHPVADFVLGLPRTVIPPTDQIQGDVGAGATASSSTTCGRLHER